MVWKLKQVIRQNKLKPRAIENRAIELGYEFGRNTIYRLLGHEEGPKNINRDSLTAIIHALRDLTNKPIKVEDLIEYTEEEKSA